jgi:hypothetical protein
VGRNSRRLVEWGLTLLVILLVCAYFVREFRYVQGQGELAAVKTTLGALRTALLLDHLKGVIDGTTQTKPVQANPFLLLAPVPANYAGVLSDANRPSLQPGTWVFDAYCSCLGYAPRYAYALTTPTDTAGVWFRVSKPPGPLQITAMQSYRWQEQPLE